MLSRVVLTPLPISAALSRLEPFWRQDPEYPVEPAVAGGGDRIAALPADPGAAGDRVLPVDPGTAGDRVLPVKKGATGARLDFYGIVRDSEPAEQEIEENQVERRTPVPIDALAYEAHEEMAIHQMEQLLARLGERYPLQAALVIHRVGTVPVGEASLLVRLLAPHREEALAACAEFINGLKTWVSIWKHPVMRPPRPS